MKKLVLGVLCAGLLAGCNMQPASVRDRTPGLGFDPADFDTTVRPQDDFFRYVNGGWLDRTPIPPDRSNYGAFTELDEQAERDVLAIIEDAARATDRPEGSDLQKIGDLYLSFMDSTRIENLGIAPLDEEFDRIDAIQNRDDVIRYIAESWMRGGSDPVGVYVGQDAKNATEYILYLSQSGLGMPDRDYYLSEQFAATRDRYINYIETIWNLSGADNGDQAAQTVLDLETRIARNHWTRVQNRDRNATYNRFTLAEAGKLTPNLDWEQLLKTAGIENVDAFIVRQPTFLQALDRMLVETPVADWKTYFRFHLVSNAASFLSQPFVDASFDFYGRALSGTEQNRPRWKRGVSLVNNVLGEMVGKHYVEKHFSPEAKTRMDQLVGNLLETFRIGIEELEWMTDSTKMEAQAKLAKFNTKIGYPDRWKDYSALTIKPDDLFGNVTRARAFEFKRNIDKLGKPIDRDEWFMTPQTVNAYYSSTMNEIVFPAAILQPPFFNVEADDAVNYGAIGAVIGHEISHGFDDQGRKSDGDGNLREWWTARDAEEYTRRAAGLVEQFGGFSPIEGMHVNGELTLGENIGDLSGLAMAYKAYQLSLNGEEAPVIDGFTGDQRFFIGWAQVWRRKYRDDELRQRLVTDPHSPSEYRTNGIVVHQPAFYTAFNINEGDLMFLPEEKRVKIW